MSAGKKKKKFQMFLQNYTIKDFYCCWRLVFCCTDKHIGTHEVITQTSEPEPASEDNSLGYKGEWILRFVDRV